MKYFYDTEFIEDGKTIDLISIGIVAEDGREFYAVSTEFNANKSSWWVIDNVLVYIPVRFNDQLRQGILDFVGSDTPEFWTFCADDDHAALCQLFGTIMDQIWGLMYTRDLNRLCDSLGNPILPKHGSGNHSAIDNARWIKQTYEFLRKQQNENFFIKSTSKNTVKRRYLGPVARYRQTGRKPK